jgi:hypothetical protein
MTDCSLDVSEAKEGSKAINASNNASGKIILNNTIITPSVEQSVNENKMTLTIE